MKKEYTITGMTCEGCVAKVQRTLSNIEGIEKAKVQRNYPQATITSSVAIDLQKVNDRLSQVGNYAISEKRADNKPAPLPEIKHHAHESSMPEESLTTYKPLLMIVGFIAGVSLLVQYPFDHFSGMLWMRHFMAGFFLVFAFFKLLNLEGFKSSYAMYDIVAAKWKSWGYIYPFVELALGVLYLINSYHFETNLATAIILGISSIGVIKSNLDKKKIKCACLGDVFNLPMSTVTIVEDLTMAGMAVLMLAIH